MTPLQMLARDMAEAEIWCSCKCHVVGSGVTHTSAHCGQCGGDREEPKRVRDARFSGFICNHSGKWMATDSLRRKTDQRTCSDCLMEVPSEVAGYIVTLERIVECAGKFGVAHTVMTAAAENALSEPVDAAMKRLFMAWRQNKRDTRPKTMYEAMTGKSPEGNDSFLDQAKKDLYG